MSISHTRHVSTTISLHRRSDIMGRQQSQIHSIADTANILSTTTSGGSPKTVPWEIRTSPPFPLRSSLPSSRQGIAGQTTLTPSGPPVGRSFTGPNGHSCAAATSTSHLVARGNSTCISCGLSHSAYCTTKGQSTRYYLRVGRPTDTASSTQNGPRRSEHWRTSSGQMDRRPGRPGLEYRR